MERDSKKIPIMGAIRHLGVGDSAEFPIEKMDSVATILAKYKLKNEGWDYMTTRDRERRVITVKRIG